jgi:ABC-type Fe3+/spermidine/putrescine transport system ATPase subunit
MPLWLSVRPESLRVVPADAPADAPAASNGANSLPATVRDIVYAGSVVKLHMALADGTTLVALRSPSDPSFASGASVHVQWPASQGVLVAD